MPTRSKKRAIPQATRRAVAMRHGCDPGGNATASCTYCGQDGRIVWHRRRNGQPSFWVTFTNLELDHRIPERRGGPGAPENIVLACRRCNRSKGTSDAPR